MTAEVLALIVAAILVVIGAVWWWRVGVGAERPASLLIGVGTIIAVGAWWLP